MEDVETPGSVMDTGPGETMSAIQQESVTLYFYDEKTNALTPELRPITARDRNDLAQFVIRELIKGPKTNGLSPVVSSDVQINKVDYVENILYVDLSSQFLDADDPVISRAALINSLLELGTFDYIKLYVDGKEITRTAEHKSFVLGLLTRYPNSVPEITAFEEQNTEGNEIYKINRELFFQDNQGMYLLPEARSIVVTGGNYVEAIVNELIKGPVAVDEGYYPTLPKGVVLEKSETIKGEDDNSGLALYFSKEFRTQFTGGSSQEIATLSSLVYSLSSLPDVNYIKIYYKNDNGDYIDEPIHNFSLDRGLTMADFPNMIGKRIRLYFGDKQGMLLVPEYRAIARDNGNIAQRILNELAGEPINPDSARVIPDILSEEIHVRVENNLALVDIPSYWFYEADKDETKMIRDLYAIVNTLTDPMNMCDIREVQILVDGKMMETIKGISLQDTFVMNPALIKE